MATYRTSAAGGSTSGTSDRTATITPAVGDLLIGVVFVSTNTNDTPTMSDNNGGGTYTRILVADVTIATVAHRMAVFVRTALMANTTSTVVTAATGSNTSGIVHVIAVSGMSRTGSSAVRSQGQQNNQAAGTPAPALNQAALTGNVTIVGVGSADTTTTAPTNWTERQDTNFATPTVALETATRDSGFTGTTITFGAAQSTTFASFAIELDGSAAPVDLVIANGTHAHSAGAPALTQVHLLAVNNASHGHTAQNAALTQVHALAVANASHAHLAGSLALVQTHVLAIGNALHGHTAETPTLEEIDTATDLVIQNGLHGHTATNLAMTQVHSLAVQNATHAHSATGITLIQVHALSIAGATHGHTAEQVAPSQVHVLAVASATHGHTAQNISVGVSLVIQNAVHAHAADVVAIQVNVTLVIQSATHAHVIDSLALSQQHQLVVANGLHSHTSETVVLTGPERELETDDPLIEWEAEEPLTGWSSDAPELAWVFAEARKGHSSITLEAPVTAWGTGTPRL